MALTFLNRQAKTRFSIGFAPKVFLDSPDHSGTEPTIHELTRKVVRDFSCILVDRLPVLRKVISFDISEPLPPGLLGQSHQYLRR
jgi:hypothetical protein